MLSRSSFLIGIGIIQIEWNPSIFEVGVECCLQGSWKTIFWLIVMHVNICQVILGGAIW